MFSLFKRDDDDIKEIYDEILNISREPKLYTDYGVPDTPQGRFQMIALHCAPYMIMWTKNHEAQKTQRLFDMIFQDIEYSFREIGVGDLAVPKKMKSYMKNFNGIIQSHSVANADHADITRRNLFDTDVKIKPLFKAYIINLFNKDRPLK